MGFKEWLGIEYPESLNTYTEKDLKGAWNMAVLECRHVLANALYRPQSKEYMQAVYEKMYLLYERT